MPFGKGFTSGRTSRNVSRSNFGSSGKGGFTRKSKVLAAPVVSRPSRPISSKAAFQRAVANANKPRGGAKVLAPKPVVSKGAGPKVLGPKAIVKTGGPKVLGPKPIVGTNKGAGPKVLGPKPIIPGKPGPKVLGPKPIVTTPSRPTGGPSRPISGGPSRPIGNTPVPPKAPPVPPKAPPVPPKPVPPKPVPPKPVPVSSITREGGGTAGRFSRRRGTRGPSSSLSVTPEMLQRIAQQRIVNRR